MSPTPEHLWTIQAEAQKEIKKLDESHQDTTERLSWKRRPLNESEKDTEEKLKKDIAQLDPDVLASMAKNGHLTLSPWTTVEDYIAMTQRHVEEPDKEPWNNENWGNVWGSAQAFTIWLGAVDASLEVTGNNLREKLQDGKISEKTYVDLVGRIDAYRWELKKLESRLSDKDKTNGYYA